MASVKRIPTEEKKADEFAQCIVAKSQDELYAEAIDKIEKLEFSQINRKNAEALFAVFDLDTSGNVSMEEVKSRFESRVGNDDVRNSLQNICSQADSSGDGFINVEEFYQALRLNLDAVPYKRLLRGAERKKVIWVNRNDIVNYISDREETMESFQSLPFYVIFFALAFVLAVAHLQVQDVFYSLDAIRSSFRDAEDAVDGWVDLENDFLDWMSGSFLEATNLDAATTPGRIQRNNQIVGGVKIMLTKSIQQACLNPADQALDVYFDYRAALDATAADEELKLCRGGKGGSSDVKWLLLTHGVEAIQELRAENWIDEFSTEIVVTFFTYNAHTDFFVVVKFSVERSKFGKVELSSTYEAFSAAPFNSLDSKATVIACDVLFLMFVLFMMVSELLEMIPILCRHGFRNGNALYWSIWSAIDWFNIICSAIICLLYYATVSQVMQMNALVQEIPMTHLDRCLNETATCDLKINGGENSVLEVLDKSILQANSVGYYYFSLRGIAVFFSFSTMLAFFKAFRSNPRLRVVTDTMVEARNDFFHFFIVFSCVFLVFVLSGYILFGNQVEPFQSAGKAIDTCGMLTLGFILDDFREDMKGAFPVLGVVWIWLFYIVIAILLFNMTLAIVFDVYEDVKTKNGAAQTMFEQARELINRKSKLANQLISSENPLAPSSAMVPTLTEAQLLRTLRNESFHKSDVMTPESIAEVYGMSFPINASISLVNDVDESMRKTKMCADISNEDVLRLVGRVDQNVRDFYADFLRDNDKAKKDSIIEQDLNSSSLESVCQEVVSGEPEDADLLTQASAALDAKLDHLESYTAHRIDMIQNKFSALLSRLDRHLGGDVENPVEEVASTYIDVEPSRQPSYVSPEIPTFGQDGQISVTTADSCSVCFETKTSIRLCGNNCRGTCENCLLQYFAIAVENALYTIPMIRCPGTCQARIPTVVWTRYARPEDVKRYKDNAIALLAVRCNACDETVSLFESYDSSLSDTGRSNGKNGAEGGSESARKDELISQAPERVFDDNAPPIVFKRKRKPLASAFRNTGNLWLTFWNGSTPADAFLDLLIKQVSLATLEKALHEENLLIHIHDLERRLAFQLAFLNRFPKIRTPCCGDKMCYKCKVTNWHLGVSCEQRQRQESGRDVQYCPNCNVPTYRSEGCNQIHCVCGEDWAWVGDDDDSMDSEEQSTAFELVAMNMNLSHNQARMLTIQLAQSGSHLTIGLGVASRNLGVMEAALELGAVPHDEDFEALQGPYPGNFMAGRPLVQDVEDALFSAAACPSWAQFYVPGASAAAYDALSDEDACDHRLFTALLRLSMGWRSEEQKQLGETVMDKADKRLGRQRREALSKETATVELCRALSDGIGFRIPDIAYVRSLLAMDADVKHRLEDLSHVDAHPKTPLEMVLVNRAEVDQLEDATTTLINLLIEYKVNLNEENEDGETPLAIALHYRNAVAVEAMLKSNEYTVSLEALDDLASISDVNIRSRVENAILTRVKLGSCLSLQEIDSWALIQMGAATQVKRLVKENYPFSELDVKALLRTRAAPAIYKQMQVMIQKKMGKKRFARAKKKAVTTILLEELREACELEREIDFEIAEKMIQMGADLRTREEEPSVETSGLCNSLELIAMNWKAGGLDSTRKLIERIVTEGGRSVLTSFSSEEEMSVPLSTALRMRNWVVAKLLVKHGAVMDDSLWTGCQECFGCDDILPILELLCKPHLDSGSSHENWEAPPIWLLLRLHHLDAAEMELSRLCEMREVLRAAKDESSDYSEEVLPPVAAKLLTVSWILRKRDDSSPRFDHIVREAYKLVNSERSFEDQVQRTATHLLLAELRWRCLREDPPDVFRIQLFLSEEGDPNVRQNELTDYNDEDSDTEFDSEDEEYDGETKDNESEDGDDA